MFIFSAVVSDNFLLTSDFYHKNIYQIDLSTCFNSSCSIARVPIGIEDKPTSVAYSKETDTIFWTDAGYHLLKKSFLNGTSMSTVLNFGMPIK